MRSTYKAPFDLFLTDYIQPIIARVCNAFIVVLCVILFVCRAFISVFLVVVFCTIFVSFRVPKFAPIRVLGVGFFWLKNGYLGLYRRQTPKMTVFSGQIKAYLYNIMDFALKFLYPLYILRKGIILMAKIRVQKGRFFI